MSALALHVAPVSARVVERPFYICDTLTLATFDEFVRMNADALADYFRALCDADQAPGCDYETFCRIQYECQRELADKFRDDGERYEWRAYDDATGLPKYGPL